MIKEIKENRMNLELLNVVYILLMVKRGIRRGICHALHR